MMDLMLDLQNQFDTSFLFISHDLANARYLTKRANGRIGVMYLGKLVEIGAPDEILDNPKHPYTKALIWSTPSIDPRRAAAEAQERAPVRTIDIPTPEDTPSGCNFHTRCPRIIPPEGLDIDQETYNDIVDFRDRLENGSLPTEEVARDLGIDPDVDSGELSADTRAAFVTNLQQWLFDRDLGSPHDDRIETALQHVVEGDRAVAVDSLREQYESVCERQEPDLRSDHPVACHLYPTSDVETRSAVTDG
jgi:peptide/nickel transport system ATP-binding protein